MAELALAMPALLGSVVALALGGLPHCAAMCGAPCAAVCGATSPRVPAQQVVQLVPRQATMRRSHAALAFHLARLVGYAAVGGLLAAGLGELGQAAATGVRLMQPVWTLWHVLALLWGLTMLVSARQPWVARLATPTGGAATALAAGKPWGTALAGLAWVAWPCGLLHAAFLMASLANTAWGGAALMLVFGAISAFGLAFGPALWRALGQHLRPRSATRWAGALLSVAALWALAERTGLVAWCFAAG